MTILGKKISPEGCALLFDQSEDLVFIMEKTKSTYRYFFANEKANKLFGVSLQGKIFSDVLPEDITGDIQRKYDQVFTSQIPLTYVDINLFSPNHYAAETTLSPIVSDKDSSYILAITKNVQHKQVLEENVLFMNSYLTHSVEPTLLVDLSGNILRANVAFAEVFGYQESLVVGKNIEDLDLHKSYDLDKETRVGLMKKIQQGNGLSGIISEKKIKNGRFSTFSISYSPIKDDLGHVTALSIVYKDISVLLKMSKELIQSKEFYKNLFSLNPHPVFELNLRGDITKANSAAQEVFGYSIQDLKGKSFADLLSPVYKVENVQKKFKEVKEQGIVDTTLKIVNHKLETLICEVTFIRVIVESELKGIFGIVKDITKETVAEMKLQKTLKDLENLKQALDSSAIVAYTDPQGLITYANEKFSEIAQFDRVDLIGKPFKLVNSNYHSEKYFQHLWGTISAGQTWRGEFRNKSKNGRIYWVDSTIVPLMDENEKISQYISIQTDITDKKIYQAELQRREEMYRLITENSHDLIMVTNRKGKITYASPSHIQLLDYPIEDLIGQNHSILISSDFVTSWNDYVNQAFIDEVGQSFESLFLSATQQEYWVETKTNPIYEQNGEIENMVFVSTEITDRKKLEQNLKYMAYHDSLTDLPNRSYLKNTFPAILREAKQLQKSIVLFYIDGDNFKEINDRHGHDVGDEFLRLFGKSIQSCLLEEDFVVRLGGDEFLVVLPNLAHKKDIIQIIIRIQKRLKKGFSIGNERFTPTSSIGISRFPFDGNELDLLMTVADKALYYAKSRGKNTYHFATE
ncbi:PAS domain S-box protein [Bacillus sp. 2205SS5-2]|uniref:PAS domain S-box protein n=1 Tax=Bacillus sp. 2205SS5-2 TaxID=3109031 RepID=UPI0030059D16